MHLKTSSLLQLLILFNNNTYLLKGLHGGYTSQYDITFDEWPWKEYPQYLTGGAYLLSHGAIVPLLAAIQTTPFMPFEDIYITGICSEKANVEIKSPLYPSSLEM